MDLFFFFCKCRQLDPSTIRATNEQLAEKRKVNANPLALNMYPDITGPITRPIEPPAPIQPIIAPY